MQNVKQKIQKRAESPVINSVGHRPTKRGVYHPKPQRGVIGMLPFQIGRCPILMIKPFQGLICERYSQNRTLPYAIDAQAFSLNCCNQSNYQLLK